ncbi:MAG: methyl-accepting chemotaxis protein [Firmicutes bacterium]|nr:methyl-accepting chemotaxis protein [Bacillota bacterium]
MNEKEHESIEKKLTKSIVKVSAITAAAALLGVIVLIIISARYSNALVNYGFAQGDIGKAMFEFADVRSSLRAAIGYDDQDAIDAVVKQHDDKIKVFNEYFAEIENTIVSADGRKTYDTIKAELNDYWELDARIMELGATTDRTLCVQAQELALTELTSAYDSIYTKLEDLLNVKVTEGNRLSNLLSAVCWVLVVVILAIIAVAMVASTKIGRTVARRISVPLQDLGARLKTFAAGDLVSPFPMVDTGDEIEHMEKDAREMADNLDTIIFDIGEVLSEMAAGNYTVRSKASDRYTGDFQKLYQSMRDLRDQMSETLLSIGEASKQVSAGSDELANAAQSLAEGATDQAGAVSELHTMISDITETMEKSAQSADESYNMSHEYANKADSSRQEMNTMMDAMKRISDTSTKIGNIISEIESIAAQTNLLSLNASIEAARAGESGRGFAVVADQIRDLADQSAKAAVDTRELIEASIREVATGNSVADHAASSIGTVVDGIKQIADFSLSLKNIMEKQAEAMRQAETDINQISGVVQSNAATAQEASATSQELSAQATMLDELVGQFELAK